MPFCRRSRHFLNVRRAIQETIGAAAGVALTAHLRLLRRGGRSVEVNNAGSEEVNNAAMARLRPTDTRPDIKR